jgi:hypothetical protein
LVVEGVSGQGDFMGAVKRLCSAAAGAAMVLTGACLPAGAAELDASTCQRFKDLPWFSKDDLESSIVKIIGEDAKGEKHETSIQVAPFRFCYVYRKDDKNLSLSCEVEFGSNAEAFEFMDAANACLRDAFYEREIKELMIEGKYRTASVRGRVPYPADKKPAGFERYASFWLNKFFEKRPKVDLSVYYY